MNKALINPTAWIDQFFDDFDKGWRREPVAFAPAVDIAEQADAYLLRVELPGVSKDNLTLEYKENRLLLGGRKDAVVQGEEGRYRYVESRSGGFSRVFELPRNVRTVAIEAEYKDGVLQLRIPKVEEAKPKSISIR
jgi:HSP20 family protein